jgi:hypothetical protein
LKKEKTNKINDAKKKKKDEEDEEWKFAINASKDGNKSDESE